MKNRRHMVMGIFFLALMMITVSIFGAEVKALDYPTRPITLIVCFSPGGGNDVNARIVSAVAEKYIDQPIVVTNLVGGGGAVGWTAGAAAQPDGYTLTFISVPTFNLHPHMREVGYEITDYEPIICFVEDPSVLALRTGGKFETFEEFLQYAQENPGKITVGNAGFGSDPHLSTEALAMEAGIDIVPVPFDGTAEAITSALGGHVDVVLGKFSEVVPLVEDGEMIALGQFTEERHPLLPPDVPTMRELGYDLVIASARGIAAPKGTPAEIIDSLHDLFKTIAEDQDYISRMETAGFDLSYRGPEDYKRLILQQDEIFAPIIEMLGLGQ